MSQCDRCGGWFGFSWTCSACQALAGYVAGRLRNAAR